MQIEVFNVGRAKALKTGGDQSMQMAWFLDFVRLLEDYFENQIVAHPNAGLPWGNHRNWHVRPADPSNDKIGDTKILYSIDRAKNIIWIQGFVWPKATNTSP